MSEQGWSKKTFVHRDYLRLVGGWTDPFLNTPQSLAVHPWKMGKTTFQGRSVQLQEGDLYIGVLSKLKPANWEVLIVLRGICHIRQCCAHLLVIGACRHHLQRHPWMRRSDTARTVRMVVHVAVSAQQASSVVPPVVVGLAASMRGRADILAQSMAAGT